MRVEIAGAQITDAIVEVIEDLQNDPEIAQAYIKTIERVTSIMILDTADMDSEEFRSLLCGLEKIRRSLSTLACPPDVDLPENDVPAARL
jgi:hypothetical protein